MYVRVFTCLLACVGGLAVVGCERDVKNAVEVDRDLVKFDKENERSFGDRRKQDVGAALDESAKSGSAALSANSKLDPSRTMPSKTIDVREPPATAEAAAEFDAESYEPTEENPFTPVRAESAVSTFSIDVDTASYANVRRFINDGALPPKDAVRIEELINYFPYEYSEPTGTAPFSVATELADCPWQPDHRLLRIALKGRTVSLDNRPPSNLVFLIDVSGSMNQANKLPLLQASLKLLVERLTANDRVAIVVYAGSAGLVLPSTSGEHHESVLAAIDALQAGGSTNGGEGIHLAYDVAKQNFIEGGINRVILATDGDFNVGVRNEGDLTRLIEERRREGVFLTALGFGTGNLQDDKLEALADKGNGNYAYIDSIKEGQKVLVEEASGTLLTIAKDVKIQIEFNPAQAAAYRLIGYENRLLRTEDFKDDSKDAGEVGAGHSVTALYEIVPAGQKAPGVQPDELVFQESPELSPEAAGGMLAKLSLRYKDPVGTESKPLDFDVKDDGLHYGQASIDFRFAAAVAGFGMILRDSPHRGNLTTAAVLELAQGGEGLDPKGYRSEFADLVKKAEPLLARR